MKKNRRLGDYSLATYNTITPMPETCATRHIAQWHMSASTDYRDSYTDHYIIIHTNTINVIISQGVINSLQDLQNGGVQPET